MGTRFSATDNELLEHFKEKTSQTNSILYSFINAFIQMYVRHTHVYNILIFSKMHMPQITLAVRQTSKAPPDITALSCLSIT
jgi:DNA-binding MltR family transcriptional regulator